MKLIKEIKESEIFGREVNKSLGKYEIRIAARAVVLDSLGKIAILSTPKSKHYHHKLPGGGLESGEEILDTLKREIKEETGCDISEIQEVGEIIEYKNQYKQKQISYCFLAKVKGRKGKPNFTEDEKESGYRIKWIELDEALKLFGDGSPKDYTAKFIQLRDSSFLLEAKKLLESGLSQEKQE